MFSLAPIHTCHFLNTGLVTTAAATNTWRSEASAFPVVSSKKWQLDQEQGRLKRSQHLSMAVQTGSSLHPGQENLSQLLHRRDTESLASEKANNSVNTTWREATAPQMQFCLRLWKQQQSKAESEVKEEHDATYVTDRAERLLHCCWSCRAVWRSRHRHLKKR